ncbi:DUF2530 domain-containing protein [Kibdelosporangium lantanae]|uniref:DUF2530 domain-containing protein n=1 Tax=Kibdelosporangium lantanae TaxID=1497396 RepID=A0ABW3MB28_9PSEU
MTTWTTGHQEREVVVSVADRRVKRLPREVREKQILDAAVQVFSEHGYHNASMDEVSEVARAVETADDQRVQHHDVRHRDKSDQTTTDLPTRGGAPGGDLEEPVKGTIGADVRHAGSLPDVPSKKEPAGGNSLPSPPAPPAKLVDLFRIVVLGTAVWAVVLVVALFTGPHILAWTAFTGAILGGIGMLIMTWQRAAAKRGSKTAQQGL